ncbi:MAG: arginase family protein, partial [Candidatus Kerfeldbacteria bacterium]|nr:arginase family protein [Candidatus Kerfeldbacteria bacterium]
GHGTSKGPAAIIAASHEVELYDEQFKNEPFNRYGIATLKQFPLPTSQRAALNLLTDITAELLQQKKFSVILGGEHSLTGGSVAGVAKVFGQRGFNILHFDAHTDLRPSFEGNRLSHASALHLAIPYFHRLVQIGIRNTSTEEQPIIRRLTKARSLQSFTAEDILRANNTVYLTKAMDFLRDRPVWLTFDVDVFDPAVIGSSTGTPEPGGLWWYGVLDALQAATKKLDIIGAEFVELLPKPGQHAPDFAVAKLIYKFLNFRFTR